MIANANENETGMRNKPRNEKQRNALNDCWLAKQTKRARDN